jgi:3-oxoacyl-[acyl-carrier-protein] synthase II
MKNVAITSYSVVAPQALDPEAFWKLIEQGVSAIGRIERFDAAPTGCAIGGEVGPFDLSFLPAGMKPKRMSRHTLLLMKAAHLLSPHLPATGKFGVRIGISTSDSAMIAQSGYQRALKGMAGANPHCVAQAPPHCAVGTIGRFLGAKEDVQTISTACAAGLEAIGLAARDISSGRSQCIVAGGGDAPLDVTPLAEFFRAGLASARNHHPAQASRPFDAFADSGVLSDAAALVLLEDMDYALDRGATILGEVIGYGSRCDESVAEPGCGYAPSMREALDSAGLNPEDIDHISAWGPGHPVLDRAEASAIEAIFGDYAGEVPVSSIKGTLGNPLAGAGPAQVIAALEGMSRGVIPHTTNLEIPLPNTRLNLVMNKPLRYDYGHVLINAHGIGGSNVSLIVKSSVGNN